MAELGKPGVLSAVAEIEAQASSAILSFVMVTWPFQFVALGFLALIWIAQWLDWESGIQERQLNWHPRRRGV
jgi:hypothetical protein